MILPKSIQTLMEALFSHGKGDDPPLLRAVFEWTRTGAGEVPAMQPGALELRRLVEKISERPWTVSDEDFGRLREAGYSEDQIFEVTVAAATGAGLRRFDAGVRALEAAGVEHLEELKTAEE